MREWQSCGQADIVLHRGLQVRVVPLRMPLVGMVRDANSAPGWSHKNDTQPVHTHDGHLMNKRARSS